jgi:hypothetical protein
LKNKEQNRLRKMEDVGVPRRTMNKEDDIEGDTHHTIIEIADTGRVYWESQTQHCHGGGVARRKGKRRR